MSESSRGVLAKILENDIEEAVIKKKPNLVIFREKLKKDDKSAVDCLLDEEGVLVINDLKYIKRFSMFRYESQYDWPVSFDSRTSIEDLTGGMVWDTYLELYQQIELNND